MTAMSNQLKELHDRLLASKPEGATHDVDSCPLCAMEQTATDPGGSMPETFTQEEVNELIANAMSEATATLQQRVAELEAQAQETEVGRAVAEAVADKDATISELQAKLDEATAARTAVETKLAETEAFWAEAIDAHVQSEELAARKDERASQAKEAGVFDEKYIEENADRFAAMSDEDWASRLDEWKVVAAAIQPVPATTKPAATALQASREETGIDGGSHLSVLGRMRRVKA